MEKVAETVDLLKKISKTCDDILDYVSKRRSTSPKSKIVQEIIASSKDASSITVWSCIQELVHSAEDQVSLYKNEINLVKTKKTANGMLVEIDDVENTPNLTEVWLGDTYGTTKNKGLKALYEDLDVIAKTLCTDKLFIEKVLESL